MKTNGTCSLEHDRCAIPSERGYGREYELLDELRIACPETGTVYVKQLEKGGCAWFADTDECDDNASTVACWVKDDGSLVWASNNIHATYSLLSELDEIGENGWKPDYISPEAMRYVEETGE